MGLDYDLMAADQVADPDVQALRTAETGLKLEDVAFDTASTTLLCDVSTGQTRLVVPTGWRWQIFDAVHGLSHPGKNPS